MFLSQEPEKGIDRNAWIFFDDFDMYMQTTQKKKKNLPQLHLEETVVRKYTCTVL